MGIRITKAGFVHIDQDGTESPAEDILDAIWDICTLDPDITLKDIIILVYSNKVLTTLVESYGQCNVEAFFKEVQKPALKSTLHYIELSRTITLQKKLKPARPDRCSINLDVHGIGPGENGVVINNWAIDFTPVSDMADVPIRLQADLEFRDYREEGSYGNPGEKFKDYFTLIEVVGELFWEISFHGSPETRNEILGEVLDAKKAVEDGTATLRPWSDIRKKFEDDDDDGDKTVH